MEQFAATVWGPLAVGLIAWSLRELRSLRLDLTKHMGAEELLRSKDQVDRAERQGTIDVRLQRIEDRLDDGGHQFTRLEDQLAGLQATVFDAVARLGAGNPELRREPHR